MKVLLRVSKKYKEQRQIRARGVLEFAWDGISRDEVQRELAKSDLVVCEPLYRPCHSTVDNQTIGDVYSYPEEIAEVFKSIFYEKESVLVFLVPTPTFQIEKPDVADLLRWFHLPGTVRFKEEVEELCRRYGWAEGLKDVRSSVQLEGFARRNCEFEEYLLRRYRESFPLRLGEMHHLGATLELLRCLTGERLEMRRNPVVGLEVSGVNGIALLVGGVFGSTPPYVLRIVGSWEALLWVGGKENGILVVRRYGKSFIVALVFDHSFLTRSVLREIIRVAERARGIMGQKGMPGERTSVEQHIEEFVRHLKARNVTEAHCKRVRMHLKRLFRMMGCGSVEEVKPEDIEGTILKLQDSEKGSGKKRMCSKTVNNYISSLKRFFSWGVERGKWSRNPSACIRLLKVTDSRERRHLKEEEVRRLLKKCPDEERRLIYQTALYTGLRLSELQSLTWDMIDFEEGLIILPASKTKSRKKQVIWLYPRLLDLLKEQRSRVGERRNVFRIPSHFERYFNKDLELAGIEKEDKEGRFVSFHSLRHTFATLLSGCGVSVRVAQSLMRHSDPRTTLKIYTHEEEEQVREALRRLPWFGDEEIKNGGGGNRTPVPGHGSGGVYADSPSS